MRGKELRKREVLTRCSYKGFYMDISSWGGSSRSGELDSPEWFDSVELLVRGAYRSVEHVLKPGIGSNEVSFCLFKRERQPRWHKHGWGTCVAWNRRGPCKLNVCNGDWLLPSTSFLPGRLALNWRFDYLTRSVVALSPRLGQLWYLLLIKASCSGPRVGTCNRHGKKDAGTVKLGEPTQPEHGKRDPRCGGWNGDARRLEDASVS